MTRFAGAPDGAVKNAAGLFAFDPAVGGLRPVRIEEIVPPPPPVETGTITGGGTVRPRGSAWRHFHFYNAGSAPVTVRITSGASAPSILYAGWAEDEIEGRIEAVSFSSAPITWRAS